MEDNRDNTILQDFGLAYIDRDSLHAYRNMFIIHKPDQQASIHNKPMQVNRTEFIYKLHPLS